MSRIIKVNRVIISLFFSAFIFFVACKSIYKNRSEVPDSIIIEGKGVGKIWLGESRKNVISILGRPDYIVTNYSKTTKDFILDKVMPQRELKLIAIDIFRNDKVGEIFMHPFYKYYFMYLERGLILYFDEYGRINSMIIVTSKFNDFTPFKGKLHLGNMSTDVYFQTVVKKYKNYYGRHDNWLPDEIRGVIYLSDNGTIHNFSRGTHLLSFISIISPIIGGTRATTFFAHSEWFTKKKMRKLRKKYGKTYMRK